MMHATNDDLGRSLGRVEGKQDAMETRLDRLEQIIEAGFAELRREIADLKASDSRRKGAWAALATIAGGLGAALGALIDWVVQHLGGHA